MLTTRRRPWFRLRISLLRNEPLSTSEDTLAPQSRDGYSEAAGERVRASKKKLAGKRVVFVINSDSGGGVEHLTKALHAHVLRCGAQARIIALYPSERASIFRKIGGLVSAAARVIGARADVVVAFQPTSSVLAMSLSRMMGCRVRIAHQSNLPESTHWLPLLLDRFVGTRGFYSVNIVNSQTTCRAFDDYPKAYRVRLRRIAHGVSWPAPSEAREQVRNGIGIPVNVQVLVSCARLSSGKSLDTIIRALPHLPEVHFVLAGDGPERDALEGLARQLDVSNRVHFLGIVSRDRIVNLFEAADVFVFPSVRETFGLAPLEAGMSGLPVVASAIPAVVEVLTIDGETPAKFVSDWNEERWAAAIRDVLADPGAGVRARTFAPCLSEHYSEQRMLDKYDALFEELVA